MAVVQKGSPWDAIGGVVNNAGSLFSNAAAGVGSALVGGVQAAGGQTQNLGQLWGGSPVRDFASNLFSATPAYAQGQPQNSSILTDTKFGTPESQVLGNNTANTANTGAGAGGMGAAQAHQNDLAAQLDAHVADSLGSLNSAETTTQQNFGNTTGQLVNAQDSALQGIQADQTNSTNEFGNLQNQTNQNYTNALGDARAQYNEQQTRNNAQLSAGGLGSSSVADALASKLGDATSNAIFNASANRDDALQKIEVGKTKIGEFYTRMTQTLKDEVSNQLTQLGSARDQAIQQIQDSRTMLSNQKFTAMQNIQAGYNGSVDQINAHATQFVANLQNVASIKQSALDQAAQMLQSYKTALTPPPSANTGAARAFQNQFEIGNANQPAPVQNTNTTLNTLKRPIDPNNPFAQGQLGVA